MTDILDLPIKEAMRTRAFELRQLIVKLEIASEQLDAGLECDGEFNWGDFGSVSHANELIRNAALTLGANDIEIN